MLWGYVIPRPQAIAGMTMGLADSVAPDMPFLR